MNDNKMKNKECHTVGRISKSNTKMYQKGGKNDTPNTHSHSLNWLAAGTIKIGGLN